MHTVLLSIGTIGKTAGILPRQHGSIAVMAAILLSTIIILLASIDIGFLFYQKRELQKVADMAAIAGAQQLAKNSTNCQAVTDMATANARDAHDFSLVASTSILSATCGTWDPVAVPAAPHYSTGGSSQPNAVRVDIRKSFGSFFGEWASQNVSAMAIATIGAPIAVFSVGSKLLQVRPDGTTPKLLHDLLGADISGTSLVSYNGLANVSLKTDGLLKELGFDIPVNADVGTIKNIVSLGTPACSGGICPLNTLLGAMSTVGGQNNLVSLLGLQAGQLTLPVKLLTDGAGRGLFTLVDTANGQSALQADLNMLQLLTTAIGVANSHRGISSGIAIPGIIDSRIGIVEPPSIGIGGIGTTAFTSQVRAFNRLQLQTGNLLKVDLPLAIDVVNGQGTITDMCNVKDANGNDTVTIAVNAPALRACVGDMTAATAFSTVGNCQSGLGNKELLSVLKASDSTKLLSLSTSFSFDMLPASGNVTLSMANPTQTISNPIDLNTTVSNLTKTVIGNVLGKLLTQGQGSVTKGNLAEGVLDANKSKSNVLKSTTEMLNSSLNSLKSFVNGLDNSVKTLLGGSLSSAVVGLLSNVGNLLTGLLTSIGNLLGNLLGNVACLASGNYNQCMIEKQLDGNQSSGSQTISNVMLSLLGLVESLLQPVLTPLGTSLQTLLNNLLGLNVGQVDVTLIDLNCGGGENIKLVH